MHPRERQGYRREIPRDLFNEAKLLKCLGKLVIRIGSAPEIRWPLKFYHKQPERGFVIQRDDSDGSIWCTNVTLKLGAVPITLSTPLNSRQDWPLEFTDEYGITVPVFDDEGNLSPEFEAWLDEQRNDIPELTDVQAQLEAEDGDS